MPRICCDRPLLPVVLFSNALAGVCLDSAVVDVSGHLGSRRVRREAEGAGALVEKKACFWQMRSKNSLRGRLKRWRSVIFAFLVTLVGDSPEVRMFEVCTVCLRSRKASPVRENSRSWLCLPCGPSPKRFMPAA